MMDKPKGSFEAEATLEDHMDYLISLPALEEGINNFFLRSHQILRFYSLEREEQPICQAVRPDPNRTIRQQKGE